VRVLGTQVSTDPARFHACGVFPWMLDKKRAMSELSAERQAYIDKMYAHSDTPADRLQKLEQAAFTEASTKNAVNTKLCAEIAAVRRIEDSM